MTRFHFIAAFLFLGGFLALVAKGVAQQPKSAPPAKALPAGLRVAGAGNSWYSENCEPLCKAAGITGHQKVRAGNTVEKLTPVLEKGEIDVFVWGHTDIAGRGMEKILPLLLELGPKHNPKFRGVYIQMPWLVHDGRQGVKSAEEYEKTDLAEMQVKLEKSRKQQEAWADAINAKAGKRVVFLVPLGDGMLELMPSKKTAPVLCAKTAPVGVAGMRWRARRAQVAPLGTRVNARSYSGPDVVA